MTHWQGERSEEPVPPDCGNCGLARSDSRAFHARDRSRDSADHRERSRGVANGRGDPRRTAGQGIRPSPVRGSCRVPIRIRESLSADLGPQRNYESRGAAAEPVGRC